MAVAPCSGAFSYSQSEKRESPSTPARWPGVMRRREASSSTRFCWRMRSSKKAASPSLDGLVSPGECKPFRNRLMREGSTFTARARRVLESSSMSITALSFEPKARRCSRTPGRGFASKGGRGVSLVSYGQPNRAGTSTARLSSSASHTWHRVGRRFSLSA